MRLGFLLEESVVEEAGSGAAFALDQGAGTVVLVTLGLTEIIEQQSLSLFIYGSKDGVDWTALPLAEFPQKFYTGVTSIPVDLNGREIQFIRAQWKVNRWGRGTKKPRFRMYVYAEFTGVETTAMVNG